MPRNPNLEAELQQSPEYQAGMEEITRIVAVTVQDEAPDVTGYYKRHVAAEGTQVVASDPFWHLVEFGSVNNPPYAPLRRGVTAAGLRFVDESRI